MASFAVDRLFSYRVGNARPQDLGFQLRIPTDPQSIMSIAAIDRPAPSTKTRASKSPAHGKIENVLVLLTAGGSVVSDERFECRADAWDCARKLADQSAALAGCSDETLKERLRVEAWDFAWDDFEQAWLPVDEDQRDAWDAR